MTEADFQSKFGRWIIHNSEMSGAYELKLTKTGSLPFNVVVPHQREKLFQAKHGTFYYKPPDVGYQNPFDCMVLKDVPAYVVVMFYKRGQKEFFMIDIDVFIHEEKTSDRKSLTEERARAIGVMHRLA